MSRLSCPVPLVAFPTPLGRMESALTDGKRCSCALHHVSDHAPSRRLPRGFCAPYAGTLPAFGAYPIPLPRSPVSTSERWRSRGDRFGRPSAVDLRRCFPVLPAEQYGGRIPAQVGNVREGRTKSLQTGTF
jgi:hypothetical protein